MISNLQLKNAKAKNKDYTIKVDTGLSLLVKTTGSKLWRYRYYYLGKPCLMSLGKYPQISMKEAREKKSEYQNLLSQGINPTTHKRTIQEKRASEKNFKEVAIEWHKRHYEGKDQRNAKLTMQRLEKYVFPVLGNRQIKKIEASEVFHIAESIQDQGYIETGKRVNTICSQIFRYGVAKGHCKQDVTQNYRGMLKTAKSKHMPTLTETKEIGELLNYIDKYTGSPITQNALGIMPYIFVRSSELAISKWDYIDWDSSQWLIPGEFMKMKRPHLIPIPPQVKTQLKRLHPITGHSDYIFPSERDPNRPMNSETLNKAIRRIEDGLYVGRMVAHGFRGMASTILNESGKFRSEIIERQLAHVEKNQVRGAYNHAEYLEERKEMMQWYANYLDSLKKL